MTALVRPRDAAEVQGVALNTYGRIAAAWELTLREAAALPDLSESTWKRAKGSDFAGALTRDSIVARSPPTLHAGAVPSTPRGPAMDAHTLPPPDSPSAVIHGMLQGRPASAASKSLPHFHPTRPDEIGQTSRLEA